MLSDNDIMSAGQGPPSFVTMRFPSDPQLEGRRRARVRWLERRRRQEEEGQRQGTRRPEGRWEPTRAAAGALRKAVVADEQLVLEEAIFEKEEAAKDPYVHEGFFYLDRDRTSVKFSFFRFKVHRRSSFVLIAV